MVVVWFVWKWLSFGTTSFFLGGVLVWKHYLSGGRSPNQFSRFVEPSWRDFALGPFGLICRLWGWRGEGRMSKPDVESDVIPDKVRGESGGNQKRARNRATRKVSRKKRRRR